MKKVDNPIWLLLTNTLPLTILFAMFYGIYNVVKSLLQPSEMYCWQNLGALLLLLYAINLAYSIFLLLRKKQIDYRFCLFMLLAFIGYSYAYFYYGVDLIPTNVPDWMLSENFYIYGWVLLTPTIFFYIYFLVQKSIESSQPNFKYDLGIAASILAVAIITFLLVIRIDFEVANVFRIMISIISIVVTLAFFFFLFRGLINFYQQKESNNIILKLVITILFPIAGLLFNNNHYPFNIWFPDINSEIDYLFGDFKNKWFYIIAVLNGILLCIPASHKPKYRLLQFWAKWVFFAYTLYFFLLFLPFLPFSIFIIACFGIGFLMLAPLFLFFFHVKSINFDYKFLKEHYKGAFLKGTSILFLMTIPLVITINFYHHKRVVNKTLNYIYAPNYGEKLNVNLRSLSHIIESIKENKEIWTDGVGLFARTPVITNFFNWIVLDNLTLSNSKINTIERIFFDTTYIEQQRISVNSSSVAITDINTSTNYDEKEKFYTSWVDFELTNSSNSNRALFETTFDLPAGTWVSNYYLNVEDRKEMGILAEKKSALWVFAQIVRGNRDPGVLYYLTGTKIAFKVFPFWSNQVRKTGIEFTHKAPVNLRIGDQSIHLGDDKLNRSSNSESESNLHYVSALDKTQYSKIRRTPYYHFIIDVSKGNDVNSIKQYQMSIDKLLHRNLIDSKNAKVSFLNSSMQTFDYKPSVFSNLDAKDFKGGFYLDRGIKTILFEKWNSNQEAIPVIVVVSNEFKEAIIENDFADFSIAIPELESFYVLNEEALNAHALDNKPFAIKALNIEKIEIDSVIQYTALSRNVYLKDDSLASIAFVPNSKRKFESINNLNRWEQGLELEAEHVHQTFHPSYSDKVWRANIKRSFKSKILARNTTYIVVENEAQKAMLKKKQQAALSGKKSLDLGDDIMKMSEPNQWLVTIFVGFLLFVMHKRRLI